jgi:hypothetical protein
MAFYFMKILKFKLNFTIKKFRHLQLDEIHEILEI